MMHFEDVWKIVDVGSCLLKMWLSSACSRAGQHWSSNLLNINMSCVSCPITFVILCEKSGMDHKKTRFFLVWMFLLHWFFKKKTYIPNSRIFVHDSTSGNSCSCNLWLTLICSSPSWQQLPFSPQPTHS